jgi:hypothetical protein
MRGATFAISCLAIVTALSDFNETCIAPTEDEFIELAMAEMISSQPNVGVISLSQNQGYALQLGNYPNKQSYLEANPDCCEIFTAQAIAEYITPRQRLQTSYSGSIRVQTTYQVTENTDPNNYPHGTYNSIRVIHFDRCGLKIDL